MVAALHGRCPAHGLCDWYVNYAKGTRVGAAQLVFVGLMCCLALMAAVIAAAHG